ncbi:MAG: Lycopene cyclase [Chloroflexi bacterium]|nr:MAG: Lycopene cyclase [Chloroflexota bacterium]
MITQRSSIDTYDFVFAGGGLAGLSLAWQIAQSPLRNRSMLIVDHDSSPIQNSTFSYWSEGSNPFLQAVSYTWDQLSVFTKDGSSRSNLGSYRYHTIRGADIYRLVSQELSACPRVTSLRGHISEMSETVEGVRILVDGREYTGKWVFDSRPRSNTGQSQTEKYLRLKMSFQGWDIETDQDVFNPRNAILMDFRTYQGSDMCFFYVLPYDERHALVEYTIFAQKPLSHSDSEAALYCYLESVFGLSAGQNFQLNHREAGCLLVTDQPFERRTGFRTLAIGLSGGRLKPSTGYAFTRIQRDSRAILRSLLQHNHPFHIPGDSPLYTLLDSLMLEVMRDYPENTQRIFSALFERNSMDNVLRFLDEDAPLSEVLRLMATLPAGLFIKIMGQRSLKPGLSKALNFGSSYSQGNRS